jgi:hypothetical protein
MILGVVATTISDLSAPLRLVTITAVGVIYWSWPRLIRSRRRDAPAEAAAPIAPQRTDQQQPPDAGDVERPPLARQSGHRWLVLHAALGAAVLVNILAVILVGASLTTMLFVDAWLLALALTLSLRELSDSVRSTLYQATALSVGTALTIGAQPIVHEIAQPSEKMVFWHAGWRISLGIPHLDIGQGAGDQAQLFIPATFYNLGDKTKSFDSQLDVAAHGKHYTEPGAGQDLPQVPGKAQQAGTIAFKVDRGFGLDDAVLTVGRSDFAQAVVPLGGSGKAMSFEPLPIRVTGTVKVGNQWDFAVNGGEVRADSPESYAEAGAGYEYLRLRVSTIADVGQCGICDNFMEAENQHFLELPDATNVTPDPGCSNFDYPGPGMIARDRIVCFQIPVPPSGNYTYFAKDQRAEGIRFRLK